MIEMRPNDKISDLLLKMREFDKHPYISLYMGNERLNSDPNSETSDAWKD